MEETEAKQTLLRLKLKELERLKQKRSKQEAESAATAEAEAERLELEALGPGAIKTSHVPHWRTWMPACGVLWMVKDQINLGPFGVGFAILCLMATVFAGQQLLNKMENTPWRRNLRVLSAARSKLSMEGDEPEVKAKSGNHEPEAKAKSGNPKKSKKAD